MTKRKFEVLLVIEGTSRQAKAAADAAWYAANDPTVRTDERHHVIEELARERLPNGTVREVDWSGWNEESGVALSVTYVGSDAPE